MSAARGATAYVTLEPCSHHGKTPPCANALIAAGVSRVVIAVTDPDPRVSGNGIRMLREAGIAVEAGMMSEAAKRGLAAYLTRQTKGRAHVTLKLAVSKDGMLGRPGEGQVRITGAQSREAVQHLRAESDAILVGIGTALADDPDLTCRLPGRRPFTGASRIGPAPAPPAVFQTGKNRASGARHCRHLRRRNAA